MKSEVGSWLSGAFPQFRVMLLEKMRLMDAEVEGVMSRCSKLNQVNADHVAQARSLNTVKATPKLNRLCNLHSWDLETCLSKVF